MMKFVFNLTPTIEPDHKLKIIWDFINIIIVLILFIGYPIQICFGLDYFFLEDLIPLKATTGVPFEVIFVLLIGFDILIKMTTAYYEKGLLVKQKQRIIWNYLTKDFIYDALAYLPIIYRVNRPTCYVDEECHPFFRILPVFIFVKGFEVMKAIRIWEEILHLGEKGFAIFQLSKLMVKILLFSHIMACLWHAVSFYSPYDSNILKVSNYVGLDWISRYLKVLFATTNPGRIDPQNNLELAFGYFALMATSSSMGFMISGIHNIMRVLGKNSEIQRLFIFF